MLSLDDVGDRFVDNGGACPLSLLRRRRSRQAPNWSRIDVGYSAERDFLAVTRGLTMPSDPSVLDNHCLTTRRTYLNSLFDSLQLYLTNTFGPDA